jgi:SUMO ligase MMS21 Smc5/6 complex component
MVNSLIKTTQILKEDMMKQPVTSQSTTINGKLKTMKEEERDKRKLPSLETISSPLVSASPSPSLDKPISDKVNPIQDKVNSIQNKLNPIPDKVNPVQSSSTVSKVSNVIQDEINEEGNIKAMPIALGLDKFLASPESSIIEVREEMEFKYHLFIIVIDSYRRLWH